MPQSRSVLIVCSDPLVAKFYGEMFARIGMRAEVVEDSHSAFGRIRARKCPLVLSDLVHERLNPIEFIKEVRTHDKALPIVVFAENPPALAQDASEAGATMVMSIENGSIDDIYRQLNAGVSADAATALTSEPDAGWTDRFTHEMPQQLYKLRVGVLELSKPASTQAPLLGRQLHQLARRFAIIRARGACALCKAIENLLCALEGLAQPIPAPLLHTVTDALDCLTLLLDPKKSARIGDPSAAQILVLDPEEASRLLIASSLEALGLKPTCTHDPEQTFLLQTTSRRELIILETTLPGTSGFEFCRKIRHLQSGSAVPVLFVGQPTLQNKAQSNLCGGNDFMGKPIIGEEMALKSLLLILRSRLEEKAHVDPSNPTQA